MIWLGVGAVSCWLSFWAGFFFSAVLGANNGR
jgi:hypothetical protein